MSGAIYELREHPTRLLHLMAAAPSHQQDSTMDSTQPPETPPASGQTDSDSKQTIDNFEQHFKH